MELCDYVCHACVFSDCINDNPGPEYYKESREIDIYSGAKIINEKNRAQQRKYYEQHKETVKAYKKKYYERCKTEGKLKCVKQITELC